MQASQRSEGAPGLDLRLEERHGPRATERGSDRADELRIYRGHLKGQSWDGLPPPLSLPRKRKTCGGPYRLSGLGGGPNKAKGKPRLWTSPTAAAQQQGPPPLCSRDLQLRRRRRAHRIDNKESGIKGGSSPPQAGKYRFPEILLLVSYPRRKITQSAAKPNRGLSHCSKLPAAVQPRRLEQLQRPPPPE